MYTSSLGTDLYHTRHCILHSESHSTCFLDRIEDPRSSNRAVIPEFEGARNFGIVSMTAAPGSEKAAPGYKKSRLLLDRGSRVNVLVFVPLHSPSSLEALGFAV